MTWVAIGTVAPGQDWTILNATITGDVAIRATITPRPPELPPYVWVQLAEFYAAPATEFRWLRRINCAQSPHVFDISLPYAIEAAGYVTRKLAARYEGSLIDPGLGFTVLLEQWVSGQPQEAVGFLDGGEYAA